MDKITKLSQAVRLAGKTWPQCRGSYFQVHDGQFSTCALGGATAVTFKLETPVGILGMRSPLIELRQRYNVPLGRLSAIIRENDAGRSMDCIADMLEAEGL